MDALLLLLLDLSFQNLNSLLLLLRLCPECTIRSLEGLKALSQIINLIPNGVPICSNSWNWKKMILKLVSMVFVIS